MSAKAVWTPDAESDLEEIVYYISVKEGRPAVAEQVAHSLKAECDRRAVAPHAAERETRLGPECRRFTFKRWVVLYRPWREGIAVLRIVDGSRDFDRVFGIT
jgi:plasmid stabilization system protein ParE